MNEQNFIIKCIESALYNSTLENYKAEQAKDYDATGRIVLGKDKYVDACFEFDMSSPAAALMYKGEKLAKAAEEHSLVPILASFYLSPIKQHVLREAGINYLDTAGNAWIETSTLLIDRSGNKRPEREYSSPRKDIFSDKATLVIRLLLKNEGLGIRQMSSMLTSEGFSLTPGYISKTVNALVESRYALKKRTRIALTNIDLLIEEWASDYRKKALKRKTDGWYYPASDAVELAEKIGAILGDDGVLTGKSGAHFVDDYASFDTVDVLCKDQPKVTNNLLELGAEQVDRGANINLLQPTYPVSSFYDTQSIDGIAIASNMQLYLDLSREERRGEEAANHLYEFVLSKSIEKAYRNE